MANDTQSQKKCRAIFVSDNDADDLVLNCKLLQGHTGDHKDEFQLHSDNPRYAGHARIVATWAKGDRHD